MNEEKEREVKIYKKKICSTINKITDFNSVEDYLAWYNQKTKYFSSAYEKDCYLVAMAHVKSFVHNMGDEFLKSLYQTLIEYGNIEDFLKEIQHEYLTRYDRII